MNINTLANYVNLDVDDTFTVQEITMWFNKGIANYNLIPPLTTYPTITYGGDEPNQNTEYALADTFMLGVMLPYINSAIRGSEASITEKQYFLSEYMQNARTFKLSVDTPSEYLLNSKNTDLSNYELGEGIYLANFENAPFAGEWSEGTDIGEMETIEEE